MPLDRGIRAADSVGRWEMSCPQSQCCVSRLEGRGMRMKFRLIGVGIAVVVLAVIGVAGALAGNGGKGNGAPSGAHFNLQIHGLNGGQGYNCKTKNNIFVRREGSCGTVATTRSP